MPNGEDTNPLVDFLNSLADTPALAGLVGQLQPEQLIQIFRATPPGADPGAFWSANLGQSMTRAGFNLGRGGATGTLDTAFVNPTQWEAAQTAAAAENVARGHVAGAGFEAEAGLLPEVAGSPVSRAEANALLEGGGPAAARGSTLSRLLRALGPLSALLQVGMTSGSTPSQTEIEQMREQPAQLLFGGFQPDFLNKILAGINPPAPAVQPTTDIEEPITDRPPSESPGLGSQIGAFQGQQGVSPQRLRKLRRVQRGSVGFDTATRVRRILRETIGEGVLPSQDFFNVIRRFEPSTVEEIVANFFSPGYQVTTRAGETTTVGDILQEANLVDSQPFVPPPVSRISAREGNLNLGPQSTLRSVQSTPRSSSFTSTLTSGPGRGSIVGGGGAYDIPRGQTRQPTTTRRSSSGGTISAI